MRCLDLGDIDSDAGAAVGGGDIGDIEDTARAADDRRQTFGENRIGGVRHLDRATTVGVEKFEAVADRLLIVLRFDGGRVCVIDPDERAVFVTQPDRHRRGGEHCARRLDLGGEEIVTRFDLGPGKALTGEIAKARDRRPADGAAANFDQAAANRLYNLLKMLTSFAQTRDELGEAFG